jgi:peptidoglycan/LPS O-acetylase OafA/YrhL
LAASSITITDPKLKNIAIWLGEISYPLYIIHAPIQRGLKSINEISSQSNLLRLIIISIASIVAAWALISIDARIRRFAMRHLNQKKYAPSK